MENVGNSSTQALFLFLDKEIGPQPTVSFELPTIIYPKLTKDQIQKVFFEAFNKKFQPYRIKGCEVINQSALKLNKLQGIPTTNSKFSHLPDAIDKNSIAGYVGRKTDLKNIAREIIELQGEGGILTIKGSGGIGKTQTIKKIAVTLSERNYFCDGIDFVDCEFISDINVFEYRALNIFNLEKSQNPRAYIRENTLEKDSLIILDNFETLLHLDDREEIISFLSFISDYATIVITSRELLDLDWETPYELSRMSTDEATEFFITGMHGRTLKDDEIRFLRENIIEGLLDNNPLAIKLITKNLPKGKSLEALQKELKEDFFEKVSDVDLKAFDSHSDINIERKLSLYASINFSYQLLDKNERMAFELVSLFPDGIDIENLKRISQQQRKKKRNSTELKPSTLAITDRVICALEKKSMLESNNNTVKLQSIVGKFADQKLSQRANIEEIYCNAFEYNRAVARACILIDKDNQFLSDKLFNDMQNNLLKSVEYIDRFDYDTEAKILYLETISEGINAVCGNQNLIEVMSEKSKCFVGKEDLLYKSIMISLRYYDGEFDSAYTDLQKIIPFNEITQFDYTNNIDKAIVNLALPLYDMEGETLFCATFDSKNERPFYGLPASLFYLGEYNQDLNNALRESFFTFEVDHNLNTLNMDHVNSYLNKLHKKQHIARMEIYYLKCKESEFDRDIVKKLVEVNPFTSGLKQLMYAFNEGDNDIAKNLYEEAIENLKHIKYYFVEAHFFYAKFLKQLDNSEHYDEIYRKGFSLAKKYYYRFLIYKFEDLKKPSLIPFRCADYPLPNDLNFDDYIELLQQQ